jgi:multiple sugar transport system ATP-binding protein
MAKITYDHVEKTYPDGTSAIPDFSLEIQDAEFMVFVGPSGCGKSTALRMTAGLEDITGGTLSIGDKVVNSLQPQERDIAMVFQDYALYPHMTVAQNMGFALRMMKLPKEEIDQRVKKAAERLSLTALLDRKPRNMSGGQRQRVAMGRAIVREPQAFLMDEPLSNLDAKLRVQMRSEIAGLQKQLGITTLYVTHDQVEAMTMGDRVAVMKNGRLMQCAAPEELYDNPDNVFVAGFIGSPKMNLVTSTLAHAPDGSARLTLGPGNELVIPAEDVAKRPGLKDVSGPVTVGIRPEGFHVSPDGAMDVTAAVVENLGSETIVSFVAQVEAASDADVRDRAQSHDEEESILAGEGQTLMTARLVPPVRLHEGDSLRLAINLDKLYLFDAAGEAIR